MLVAHVPPEGVAKFEEYERRMLGLLADQVADPSDGSEAPTG